MSTSAFYEADFNSALFPLQANRLMIRLHEKELSDYVYQMVLDKSVKAHSFLPQQQVHATKPRAHLRRTVKLDPVAEYFIYDLVYRNRALFKQPLGPKREAFGYRFQEGNHIAVHTAYKAFRARVYNCKNDYAHFLSFDIAAYFNTLYHHDVVAWFAHAGGDDSDVEAFGQFGREINSGRSIDFLPQGIFPAKMIGSEFLKFIDHHGELKSAVLLRFMDDFYLFDNDADTVRSDFLKIQQLLGSKSLNVNAAKTQIDAVATDVGSKVRQIRDALYNVAAGDGELAASGDDEHEPNDEAQPAALTPQQLATLSDLLKEEHLDENDADKILDLMLGDSEVALSVIPDLLRRFPNIVRSVYQKSPAIRDSAALAETILAFVAASSAILEYQVFWRKRPANTVLTVTPRVGSRSYVRAKRPRAAVRRCD